MKHRNLIEAGERVFLGWLLTARRICTYNDKILVSIEHTHIATDAWEDDATVIGNGAASSGMHEAWRCSHPQSRVDAKTLSRGEGWERGKLCVQEL